MTETSYLCHKCGGQGRRFRLFLWRRHHSKPCKTCNGTGWITDQIIDPHGGMWSN